MKGIALYLFAGLVFLMVHFWLFLPAPAAGPIAMGYITVFVLVTWPAWLTAELCVGLIYLIGRAVLFLLGLPA